MEDERRKRSNVWRYFKEISAGQAKCELCANTYSFKSGSTSNLSRHLKMKHIGIEVESAKKIHLSKPSSQSLPTMETDPHAQPSTSQHAAPTQEISTRTSASTSTQILRKNQQTNISQYMQRPVSVLKSKRLDELLLKFIVKQFHPFNIVDQPEFRELLRELNSGYLLPSRKTCSNSLLDQVYNNTVEKVQNDLKCIEACSITADGWTSDANDSYIAITIHYLSDECQFRSALLDCFVYNERHTAENIASEIKAVCTKWNVERKVVAIVSDNAANMVAAARILGWAHIPCFAHTLNLIIQHALKEIKEIQAKTKTVVEYFKRSSHANAKLKMMQKQMGLQEQSLKQEVPTRWNSSLLMFQTVVKNKEAILSTLALLNPEIMLNEREFNVLGKLCILLQPFLEITEEVSSEKEITISKLILFSRGLVKFFFQYNEAEDEEDVKNFVKKIREELRKRFADIEEKSVLAEATVLDPRFKKQGFENQRSYEKVKQTIYHKAGHVVVGGDGNGVDNMEVDNEQEERATSRKTYIWDDFDSVTSKFQATVSPATAAIVEFDKYIQEPLLARKQNPFKWWRDRQIYYPRLFQLMQNRLCIVGSSVPCERVFSKGGNILTEKRRRLKPNKLSKLLFLNYNL